MPIYIYKNNQQYGPFDESVVAGWLRSGQCSPNDLAWREGLSEWRPLGTIIQTNVGPASYSRPTSSPTDAVESFEKGLNAGRAGAHDAAIKLFDECICNNPPAYIAAQAYWNLAVALHSKYDFGERSGSSLSNAEMKWLQRMLKCATRVTRIYETHLSHITDEEIKDVLENIYTSAKEMYEGYKYMGATHGSALRDFDVVRRTRVEPLWCLYEEESKEA